MRSYQHMSFFEFQHCFASEEACFQYLKNTRFSNGFICPKCGYNKAYYIESRKLFQCKHCSQQTSVTANTIFHKTRTPLYKWFWAIYLISSDKGGISSMRLSKLLRISYVTAWTMGHKIRSALDAPSLLLYHKLNHIIDMNEVTFDCGGGGRKHFIPGHTPGRLVAVEFQPAAPGHIAMKTMRMEKPDVIGAFAHNSINERCLIRTGPHHNCSMPDTTSMNDIFDKFATTDEDPLTHWWAGIIAGNLKNFLRGTYFSVSKKHLQRYLNEFCFRFNRRFSENQIFDRMLCACVGGQKITYSELIA